MSRGFIFYSFLLVFSISFTHGNCQGVFDKIKAGLQNARNYLETAKDIADLVSNSLKRKEVKEKKRGDDADFSTEKERQTSYEPTNFVSTFFRLLGLDSRKITAVAVNSFIFFAQMISELFKITPKVERSKAVDENDDPWSPIRLITESENEKVQNLLKQAKDHDLPKQLIEYADGFDSSCIRLLLCKTTPIILAAQKSLKNGSVNGRRDITSWLPSKDKFEEFSDECEEKHTDCELNYKS